MSQLSLFMGQDSPATCKTGYPPTQERLFYACFRPVAPFMDHYDQKSILGLSAAARTGDDYSASWLVYGQDILLSNVPPEKGCPWPGVPHGEQVDWLGICDVALLVLKSHPRQLGVTPVWAVPAIGLRISGGERMGNAMLETLLEKANAFAAPYIGRPLRTGTGTGGNPSPLDCLWVTAAYDETRTIVHGVRP